MSRNDNYFDRGAICVQSYGIGIWCHVFVYLFILLIVLIPQIINAQENEVKNKNPYQQVSIPDTQLRTLKSSIMNEEYHLYINLPKSYWDEKTKKIYPVMYLLDAQWDFSLLSAIFGSQYYDGFLDEIIIVGITWGGENPNYDALRGRDFVPVQASGQPQTEGAAKFLSVIRDEIIPFIESEYPVMKADRGLMGCSLGGLFTLYAMFQETSLFKRYVVASPALMWGNGIIYPFEKDFASKNSKLAANVFMVIGEYERVDELRDLADLMKQRNYQGLKLEYALATGMGHSGTKAVGYSLGLQSVYARPSIKLELKELERYVGTYNMMGDEIRMLVENGMLVSIYKEQMRSVWYAQTRTDFYQKGMYSLVHFKEDQEGRVTGFQLDLFNGSFFVEKEK